MCRKSTSAAGASPEIVGMTLDQPLVRSTYDRQNLFMVVWMLDLPSTENSHRDIAVNLIRASNSVAVGAFPAPAAPPSLSILLCPAV